jgi:hypothetical protein
MKSKLKTITITTTFIVAVWAFNSCKKEEKVTNTDKELFEMAKATSGFTWFKNSSSLLGKSAGSAHPQAFLRTRYNAAAATQLDANGKILSGAIFPEGSFIVKELHDNATTLGRYAILYKNSGSADADARGWVWGYINAEGTVAEPASKKGISCIGCHSQANNIDYMLMNKFFP